MISGGTAAQIYSRCMNKELITKLDYIDSDVPVTARIDGVNLVTEGEISF